MVEEVVGSELGAVFGDGVETEGTTDGEYLMVRVDVGAAVGSFDGFGAVIVATDGQ